MRQRMEATVFIIQGAGRSYCYNNYWYFLPLTAIAATATDTCRTDVDNTIMI